MNVQNLPSQADIEKALGLDGKNRQRQRLSRAAWLAAVAAILALGLWWLWQAAGGPAAIAYETEKASLSDLTITVQATGKVQPTTQVDVSSEMSGVVRAVRVENNDKVAKGDVLAELDSARIRAQLERAKAQEAAARARLADSRATLEERKLALGRIEALGKKGVSSIQELEIARAAMARAMASVNAAEADIAVAIADVRMQETDLSKTLILSPVDGIVLKRAVEPGQTVASSLQAPVLFTLAEDLARMQVEADVDEADIGQVRAGQDATFTVDTFPARPFKAVIDTIEFSPKVTDNVVTYKAVLLVDNEDLLLRPGMTATAQIVVEDIKRTLAVPSAALRYEPPKDDAGKAFNITNLFMPRMPRFEKSKTSTAVNGERSLWVLENGKPREIKVRTGAGNGEMTAILGGDLKEGMDVITGSRTGEP